MKEEDTKQALRYFHDMSLMLYYPEVTNVVFIDSKPILEILKQLLALTYVDDRNVRVLILARVYRESIQRPYRSCCMSAYLLKVTFRILQYTLSMNIIIKRHVGCHSHELAMAKGPNSWILTALLL